MVSIRANLAILALCEQPADAVPRLALPAAHLQRCATNQRLTNAFEDLEGLDRLELHFVLARHVTELHHVLRHGRQLLFVVQFGALNVVVLIIDFLLRLNELGLHHLLLSLQVHDHVLQLPLASKQVHRLCISRSDLISQ